MMALQPHLTEQEVKALTLAALGMPAHEIARRLGADATTGSAILASARQKMGARTLLEALARAIRSGIIPVDSMRM